MSNISNSTGAMTINNIASGHVYVMTHSLFSDVIKIGCTPENPQTYASLLSAKTIGEYRVAFSLLCSNPCKVKKQLKKYLKAQEYVNEFYQVPAEVAVKLLKREILKIPNLTSI
ncbi:GIY-YIG nuclease family protein [Colwellia piezophila]|uniref:GIY-YIG nuclease family protein n=1 Tax=Colwellia piezophila TaxID=211668 RepID=UPI000373973D|nr:GIY-YIG nuclease family protein [Colwellia piezophila]